jgi:hypothetical protein
MDVATLAQLLRETAERHDVVEKAAAAHDWWDWYAPYLSAREQGRTEQEATEAADRYLEETRGIVVPRDGQAGVSSGSALGSAPASS